MDDDKLGIWIRAERVTVNGGWRSVGSPPSVSDRDLGQERLGSVHGRVGDLLAQTCNLANLLEVVNVVFVPIDANARRVVTTVFLASEAVTKDFTNSFAILRLTHRQDHGALRSDLRGDETKLTFSWR